MSTSSSSSSKKNLGQQVVETGQKVVETGQKAVEYCITKGKEVVNTFSSQKNLPPKIRTSLDNIDKDHKKTKTRFDDILTKQKLTRDNYPVMNQILTRYDNTFNEISSGRIKDNKLQDKINELQILSDEFKKEFKKNFDKSTNTYLIFIVIFILLIVFTVSAYYIFRNKKGGKKIKKIYHERVN